MPFHITCACGRLTVVPDEAAGQTVRCAGCSMELEVPRVDAPLPPPAPAPIEPAEPAQPLIVVTADSSPARRPVRDPHRQTLHLLAVAIAALALLSIIPIVVAMGQPLLEQPTSMAGGRVLQPWAMAIMLVAILHIAYMLYLLQLPDYSCVRVVSLFLLLVATSYAVMLGIRLLASGENRILESLGLEGNLFSSGQEASWCFLMMIITGVLSYLTGRAASRWQRETLV
jgi:hypothetical protein